MISFFVLGLPQPQGSAKAFVQNGRTHITSDNPKMKSWRNDVKCEAQKHFTKPELDAPMIVTAVFCLPRPKGHYGTGRNAGVVKASAPDVPAVKPDVDKLARALLDALTGVAYRDDAQVTTLTVRKAYTDESVGTFISVGGTQ